MTWILNTIVSASLRRVSLGISANLRITVSGLAKLLNPKLNRITKLNNTHDIMHFLELLVADTTNPDWEPIMKKASAVVTNRGSRTCHAAIVAREIGVPAVVGCGNATEVLKNTQ